MRSIKPMYQSLLLLSVITLSFSCSKNTAPAVTPDNTIALPEIKNGRLAFASTNDFRQCLRKLSQGDQEAFNKRSTGNNFSSLYNTSDESDLPSFLKCLLNQQGEVQIGDSISWFSDTKQFYIHEKEAVNLDALKKHPGNDIRFTPAYAEKIFQTKQVTTEQTIVNDINNRGDGKWQHEFWAEAPAQGNRKYVFEVAGYVFNTDRYLVLRLKLEWKGSGSWKAAGESRTMSGNVWGTATLSGATGIYFYGPTFNFGFSTTSNVSEDIGIAAFDVTGAVASSHYWTLNMAGSITMQIVGDVASNSWTITRTGVEPLVDPYLW